MEGKGNHTRCPEVEKAQAYLDGILPSPQRIAFEHHLGRCEVCQAEISSFRRMNEELAEAARQLPLPGLDLRRIEAALFDDPHGRRRHWLPGIAIASAAAAAVLLLVLLWPAPHHVEQSGGEGVAAQAPPEAPARVAPPAPGDRVALVLSDDARSQTVPLEEGGREVRLGAGTLAVFLPPPIEGRFVVWTPAGSVEATGTAFMVRVVDDRTTAVWLFQGSLRLSPLDGDARSVQAPAMAGLHSGGVATAHGVPAGVEPPADDRDPLARIRRLLAQRKIASATRALRRHLNGNPGDWSALFLLGDANRLAGNVEDALELYQRVGEKSSEPTQAEAALYEAGRLQLHELHRADDALATFRRILSDHPRGLLLQEVFFHLGECHLARKDFPQAVRAFEEYLRRFPEGTKQREVRTLLRALREKGWR